MKLFSIYIGEEEDVVEGDETIPLQDMNKNGLNNGEADAVSNTTTAHKTTLTSNQNGHTADTVVSIVSSTPEPNTDNRYINVKCIVPNEIPIISYRRFLSLFLSFMTLKDINVDINQHANLLKLC